MLPVELLPGPDWNSSEQIAWKPLPGPKPIRSGPSPRKSAHAGGSRGDPAAPGSQPVRGGEAGTSRTDSADGLSPASRRRRRPAAMPQGDAASVQDFFRRLVETGPESTERQANPAGGAWLAESRRRWSSAAMAAGGRSPCGTRSAPPWAAEFFTNWKQEGAGGGDQGNYARFWRNLVYWLTENSSIGRRRRLIATRHEQAVLSPRGRCRDRVVRVQRTGAADQGLPDRRRGSRPNSSLKEIPGGSLALKWPEGIPAHERGEGPTSPGVRSSEIRWWPEGGQAGVRPQAGDRRAALLSGAASQSLRLELTAYEDQTQVDSTSLDVQILHDPFELQDPFPNHDLLKRIATLSGGKSPRGPMIWRRCWRRSRSRWGGSGGELQSGLEFVVALVLAGGSVDGGVVVAAAGRAGVSGAGRRW